MVILARTIIGLGQVIRLATIFRRKVAGIAGLIRMIIRCRMIIHARIVIAVRMIVLARMIVSRRMTDRCSAGSFVFILFSGLGWLLGNRSLVARIVRERRHTQLLRRVLAGTFDVLEFTGLRAHGRAGP